MSCQHVVRCKQIVILSLTILLLSACGGGGGGGPTSGKPGVPLMMNLGTPATEPAVIPPSTNDTQVTFLAMVTGTALPPDSLSLDEVNSAGDVVKAGVTQLHDDGRNADLKRGDRIYTGTLYISSVSAAEKNYRVSTTFNGKPLTSRATNFWVSGCPATSRPSDPAQAVYDSVSNSEIFANEVMLRTTADVPPDLSIINNQIVNVPGVQGHVVGCIPALRQYLIEITNPDTPSDAPGVYKAITILKQNTAQVAAAFPNGQSLAQPLSPLNSSLLCDGTNQTNCQWYLDQIRAPQAWALAGGGDPQMAVAMIDFGVDCQLNGLPCDPTLNHQDPIDHGTGVAGVLASPNNPTGMVGAAYNTELYPYNFLGKAGSLYKMSELITKALSQTDVRVINISAGTGADFDNQIKTAVCHAIGSGRLVVAAAGNPVNTNNANSCQLSNIFPASYNVPGASCDNGADLQGGLLVVGATDIDNNLARWNDGSQNLCSNQKYVNLYAPGKGIITLSTTATSANSNTGTVGYAIKSGTSYAAPLVSAAAAVLWSAHPGDTPKQIHDQLINTAGSLTTDTSSATPQRLQTTDGSMAGKPMLDMYRAVGGVDSVATPDNTPDAFTITPITDADLQSDITSDPIIVQGIDSAIPIQIIGGYYSVNGGPFTNANGSVHKDDQVRVQVHSASDFTTSVVATLTLGTLTKGGQSQDFNVTTRAADNTPGNFAFASKTDMAPGSSVTSDSQTINGIDPGTAISISADRSDAQAQYAIQPAGNSNFGSFTTGGTINAGDSVEIQVNAPADLASSVTVTLTVGTVQRTFVVSTPLPDTTPADFSFTPVTGVDPGTTQTAGPITVGGINTATQISISEGSYAIVPAGSSGTPTAASYTSDIGSVNKDDQVWVQVNASDQSQGTASATLSIGNVTRAFNVTTKTLITKPDPFSFTSKTVVTGTTPSVLSDTVTISGINTAVPISISADRSDANAQYAIGENGVAGTNFTSAPGTIDPATLTAPITVTLKVTPPPTDATAVNVTLIVGAAQKIFTVTTTGAITTPTSLAFDTPSIKDVDLGSPQTANVAISGINTASPFTLTVNSDSTVQYSLDSGANYINSTSGSVTDGQIITVQLTASASPNTTNSVTLAMGNLSTTFSVTTLPLITVSTNITTNVPTPNATVGSVSRSSVDVLKNATTSFIITPLTGVTANVDGCGGAAQSNVSGQFTYTTAPITAACTVNVAFNDVTPPVIQLNGPATLDLYVGDTFTDAGAIVKDNIDAQQTITSPDAASVDTTSTGAGKSYTLHYDYTDAAGNPATEVTRTVNVHALPIVSFNAASISPNVSENVHTVTLTVNISPGSVKDVTLPFSVDTSSTNSATGGGVDYKLSSSSPLSIKAGDTTATISFDVVDDTLVENPETVKINLGTPTNAVLSSAAANNTSTTTINDNDVTVTTGKISPSGAGSLSIGSATVTMGQTTTVAVNTTTGYVFNGNISANTGTCALTPDTNNTNLYTVTIASPAATQTCTINVTYQIPVTAAVDANGNGTINGSTTASVNVNSGDTASFKVQPSSGYVLSAVDATACSGAQANLDPANNSFTVGPITSPCNNNVSVSFAKQTYTVTGVASPSTGGSVFALGTTNTSIAVDSGNTATFTITAASGYRIDSVNSNCGPTDANVTSNPYNYTTGAITTSGCTVTANFVPQLTLGASALSKSVHLEWNDIGATSYDLYYTTDSSCSLVDLSTCATATLISSPVSPYYLSSLTNGMPYYFQLKATLSSGATVLSNAVSVMPGAIAFNDAVEATTVDSANGKLYAGGLFTNVGVASGGGVPFSTTNSWPSSWNYARVDGRVQVAVSDGANGYYIGGNFTTVDGQPRSNLAHILADGTLDPAWAPSVNYGDVIALAFSGTKLYVGGNFQNITANNVSSQQYIAAINTDGTVDTTWTVKVDSSVTVLALSGSKLYMVGGFNNITIGTVTTARTHLAAINLTDGSLDGWSPQVNGSVYTLAVSGSVVYLGGSFTSVTIYDPVTTTSTTTIGYGSLAAVNVDGTLDSSWMPTVDGMVYSVVASGSDLYIGGTFSHITANGNTTTSNHLAALALTDGTVDMNWAPAADGTVDALAVSGNSIYIGGEFKNVTANGVSGQRVGLAAITLGGSLNTGWIPSLNFPITSQTANERLVNQDYISSVTVSGGSVYVGGGFVGIAVNGLETARDHLAVVNVSDGTLDPTWVSGVDGEVAALSLLGTKVYVGGAFSNAVINGVTTPRGNLAAFNTDGTLDTVWAPSVGVGQYTIVRSILPTSSTVYVGGYFSQITVNGTSYNCSNLAAVNTDGTFNSAWLPTANSSVYALVMSGTTVYMGGTFNNVNTTTLDGLAAVNATDGSLVTSWEPQAVFNTLTGPSPAYVNALAISGTMIYVGGDFGAIIDSTGANTTRNSLAAISTTGVLDTNWAPDPGNSSYFNSVQVSGSMVYIAGLSSNVTVGTTSYPRKDLFAIDTTGAMNTTWVPTPNTVGAISSLTTDGTNVYVGGGFIGMNGIPSGSFAVLDPTTGALVFQ